MENIDLTQEYFFKGNKIGCLLIHGITATPAILRELGEKLKDEGYTVLGVRLAGHGTSVEELRKTKYSEWIASVKDAYDRLKECCDKVYVIGHSLGGVLTLYLGENYPVDKLVTLAPAIINKDKRTIFAPIVKYFVKDIIWGSAPGEKNESKYFLGYDRIPVASIQELNKIERVVRKELFKVTAPLLLVQSENDEAVDAKGISIIEKSVKSPFKKIMLSNCTHNLTVQGEKDRVFEEVSKFLKE